MRPARPVGLAVIGAVLLVAAGAACGSGDQDEPWNRLGPPDYRTQREARAFKAFPIYWVGRSFQGLPLTGVVRSNIDVLDRPGQTTPPTRAVPSFGFIYGRCTAPGDPPPDADHACTLPGVEVSTSPLCANYPALFRGSLGRLRRQGAGALVATQHGQAFVFTGKTFISIAANDRRQALRAVRELRSINAPHRRISLIAPDRSEIKRKPRCAGLSHLSR